MFDVKEYVDKIYSTESKNIPTCAFLFRDFGVKLGCKYFVETGTHLGHGVQYALDHGFEQILSCEFMEDRYQHCMDRFSDNDNVSLYCGNSLECMPKMLESIDDKACFWLDAHWEGGGVPTFEELEMIKNHPIKNHTIIIDDIPVCFDDLDRKKLEQLILLINPKYKIEYFPVYFGQEPTYTTHKLINDYQLLAYI
jgi:hypothetical protein